MYPHSSAHTNKCKSPLLPKVDNSRASNSVVFVARLSGCVSALHHISKDEGRAGVGGRTAMLQSSTSCNYEACGTQWRPLWMVIWLRAALSYRRVRRWIKAGATVQGRRVIKNEGSREGQDGGSGEGSQHRGVMMMHGNTCGSPPHLPLLPISSLLYRSISDCAALSVEIHQP